MGGSFAAQASVVLVVVLVAACNKDYGSENAAPTGPDGGGGGVDGSADGAVVAPDGFAVSVDPPTVDVAAGQATNVRVVVARGSAFTKAVAINLTNLPQGVFGSPITIAAGASDGTVALNALPSATIGTTDVTVTGTADGAVSANAKLSLIVRGVPGTFDASFGDGGVLTLAIKALALAAQPDGKIVILGSVAVQRSGGTSIGFALSRHEANGALDMTFGTKGIDAFAVGPENDAPSTVAIQPDGKIVVGGSSVTSLPSRDFATARRMPQGGVDLSFGAAQSGARITSVGLNDYVVAQLVQPDGKVVVAGYTLNGATTPETVLVRYLATGAPDTSFPELRWGGVVLADAKLQPDDGKIVACGGGSIARWDSAGAPDPSFGNMGVVTLNGTTCAALAIQSDGRIVLGGGDFRATRLMTNGTVDTTFGIQGIFSTTVPGDGKALDIVLSNGVALVGAWIKQPPGGYQDVPALVKATKDGALDATFATGGKYLAPLGASDASYDHVIKDASGRLLMIEAGKVVRFWQ